MQQGIKRDPTLVIKLRATFMKVNKATFVCFFLIFLPSFQKKLGYIVLHLSVGCSKSCLIDNWRMHGPNVFEVLRSKVKVVVTYCKDFDYNLN